MDYDDLETHVKVLGWLNLLGNVLILLLGIFGLLFLSGLGVVSGDPVAVKVLTFLGAFGLMFFAVLALPGLLAGYGLLTRKPWARVLALVVGFLSLLNFPIGTAMGAYAFWVLLQEDAPDYFTAMKIA